MGWTQKEYDMLLEHIRKEGEEVRKCKKAARKFLIDGGFLTPSGKIPKQLRGLLIKKKK